jgi:flagellar basal-body rod protein FlgC
MTEAMQTGAQAMQAFGTALDVTANNIANVSTEGYHAKSAVLAEGSSGQGVQVAGVSVSKAEGVDLTREMTGMMFAERGFEANATVVRAAEETTGHILDLIV